jgi:DNA polymerase-3 subunit epsilon
MTAERQVVLDTETTGLDHRTGDRVIEIGCVVLAGRQVGNERFHVYLNPEREIDPGAVAIHGLTDEFLADKPKFRDVADEFIEFVRGAELIIHNASFDVGFLNAELARLGRESLKDICGVEPIDTLKEARNMRPGRKNSLDALCTEFGIDNSNRQWHGALLDAELLAEVYLAMTRGQNSLAIDFDRPRARRADNVVARPPLIVRRANEAELLEHQRVLGEVAKESKGNCLWQKLEAEAESGENHVVASH